ncbi:hypothetical protein ACFL7D_06990 [candidate division KSB1 bacterium]
MADRNLNLAKIKAFDDIKRMIRFLQEEQEAIQGTAKKREFFRKNIETIYESNFKKKIPIEEFESIIFDICISRTLIMSDINEAIVSKKIEDAILTFNIRNKSLISEKIALAVANDPRAKGRIKALVENKYKEVVTPIISVMIKELIPNKEIDSREIIVEVKKERFDLDTVTISKIFSKELKAYQELNRDAYKRDLDMKRRFGKGADIKRDGRAPGAKTPVEKMNMIVSREKKRKEEFITTLEEIVFKLSETYLDDNTRVFVHSANYKRKRIVIISYAQEGEIDNVSILFENEQGKQGGEFFFDLGELQALDENVTSPFIKSKLGLFSKVLGVPAILEAIWFLSNVLTADRKLPFKSVEFIQDSFLVYLEAIETEIYKKTVQQAIGGK